MHVHVCVCARACVYTGVGWLVRMCAYAMVWRPSSVRPSFRPSTVFKMLLLRHFSTDFDSDCFIR